MHIKRILLESGLEVNPVYTQEDLENTGSISEIGKPGQFPFTRGIHPLMYRKRPFTIRQYAGFGTPEETHERFLYLKIPQLRGNSYFIESNAGFKTVPFLLASSPSFLICMSFLPEENQYLYLSQAEWCQRTTFFLHRK